MKKIFVAFATKTCSVYREYNTNDDLYAFVKDCTGTSKYFVAIENGKVVYEYKRGISPDKVNLKTFKVEPLRDVTQADVKRVRYAFSRRLINCNPDHFDKMMRDAEAEGII